MLQLSHTERFGYFEVRRRRFMFTQVTAQLIELF